MMSPDRRDPLKIDELDDDAVSQSALEACGFADWETARATLLRLQARSGGTLPDCYPYLKAALASAADPDRSLVNIERLAESYGQDFFEQLKKNPRVIEILVTLFSSSPFLTEILLRSPDGLELLRRRPLLTERKTIDQYQAEATAAFQAAAGEVEKLDAIRRYQRRQLLRIGCSDLLGLYDLRAVFSQLTRMAIGLVRACLVLASQQSGEKPAGFVVLAMGKLGGWELNYSSDIDLLFVAREDAGQYVSLAERLIDNISRTTTEGFLYRVDLRLRPWGHDGPLITTVAGHVQYMQAHARLWERQALLKARPIAGNLALGEDLRRQIEPFIFQASPEEVRSSIFGMKQRTEEFLQEKGRGWGEVKLGEGSIRDVEFVVQSLQLIHPAVRTRATLKAIPQLRDHGWLTASESRLLMDGYTFLRAIEHSLQMIDYRQINTLPADPKAIDLIARRLGFEGRNAGEHFTRQYEHTSQSIRSIFLKYVGNQTASAAPESPAESPDVLKHIARMDSSYAATFTQEEIQQHAGLAARLDSQNAAEIQIQPLDGSRWKISVVAYDYLGEFSLICGLMFVYDLDILESHIFTYEPGEGEKDERRKIVDVFAVRSVAAARPTDEMWKSYREELQGLLGKLQGGKRREAQGDLAKRVGQVFQGMTVRDTPLYPIDIEIDNELSGRCTVLRISTVDTVGFLYEFSNALSLSHINIERMDVRSIGTRVSDTIYVTDERGRKVTSAEKQRELRAATVLIKHFTHLLPRSPNPESALLHFREFLGQLFKRPNWPDEFARLDRPEVLDALAQLLGVSDFLWDDFLRMQYANLFPVVRDVDLLSASKTAGQLKDELEAQLSRSGDWRDALNAFKDREMFRIDMRHILGLTPEFWDFSSELTDLVELVVRTAYDLELKGLIEQHGLPRTERNRPDVATVVALGKCGGRELGFASDIELMLVYSGSGKSGGAKPVPTGDFYEELLHGLIKSIRARQEGIFHIDLQLRPYGKAGSLAVSLEAFQRYYAPDGPAWAYERQALVKLRPIAGDPGLGERICTLRDRYVYNGEPFDVTSMRAMREKQVRHLASAGTFNAKYSPGGLVDVEYLIQGLQITHGVTNPSLRLTNIRQAMAALNAAGILADDDYSRLRKAHTFLRWLIDSLRVVRGNSKDVDIPPQDSEEFAFLARRLRYGADVAS